MLQSIVFSLKLTWKVDKKRLLYELIYNIIKQVFNVFYGVYFLRIILVSIETEKNIHKVIAVLFFMLFLNILFYLVNNHYKEVYLPCFDTKIKEYLYENIAKTATSVTFDNYNQPDFIDKYKRIIENTGPKVQNIIFSLGTISGLLIALIMVAVYVVRVDIWAIFLSIFPLIYSYFISEKSEKYKFNLEQLNTTPNRKKDFCRRAFYLPQYAKEIKISKISEVINKMYVESVNEIVNNHKTKGKIIAFFNFVEFCISDVFIVMLPIAYVAVRMLTGSSLLIGDFIGIAQSITYFSWDLEWFFDTVVDIKSASFYIKEYQSFMNDHANVHIDFNPAINNLNNETFNEITFENVSYLYPGTHDGNYAIKDVSFSIKKGEKIAIVGENGAGKTTLIYLLINLLKCTNGIIKINGVDINKINTETLKNFFGIVTQDFHIYPLTIRENISINGPLEDNKVWDALKYMKLDTIITDLDQQLTHEFSDEGIELSGGQKQKLAITRVIANQYPFIIMDEPTSALDPVSELELYKLILQYASNRTLVFISHRLATTHFVDRILVMKNGKIIETGNHDQLMALKGYYYELYTTQSNQF
jgi:ATP-binding cassette subfamily B protein